MEFLDREKDLKKTDPEMTTRTVRRGDSLTSIAAEVYRNPALWRVVAEANRIDDPLRLAAGTKLSIPKL
jgi:nucleoid-associated protein YgaU